MISSAILALGLVLATASQLRLPAVPLGIGEVCLALWLGLASLHMLAGHRICNERALLRLGAFWTAFTLMLSAGLCLALMRVNFDVASVLHDAFAYLLVAAISCLMAATMRSDSTAHYALVFLVSFWSIAVVAQLAMGWNWFSLSSVDPWYWDRFRGWSENPNQMALYCAVLAPLSLHLAVATRRTTRLVAAFSCAGSLLVGRLTKSDTFLGTMIVSAGLFVLLHLRGWLTYRVHRSSWRFAVATLLVVAIVPISLSLAPYAVATADDVEGIAARLTKDGGGEATKRTATLRLQLWEDAMLIGLESGSLGLGPGPHLEKPTGITDKGIPLPLEAHNTLMDVFTQAGLLGILAVVGLFCGTFVLLIRARLDALAVLIVALGIFSVTHFILRHPLVWFALALSLILTSKTTPLRVRAGG